MPRSIDVQNIEIANQQRLRARCVHPDGKPLDISKRDLTRSIPERLALTAAAIPHAVAVRTPETTLTFTELDERSNQLARWIIDRTEGRQGTVALLMDETEWRAVAIHGAIKTGLPFVDLDTGDPRSRLQHILEDSDAVAIVADWANATRAAALAGDRLELLPIEDLPKKLSKIALDLMIQPDDPLCLVYTSGSTGLPKSVVQTHRYFMRYFVEADEYIHLCPSDRCLGMGARSIVAGWVLNGAQVCLYPNAKSDVSGFARWVSQQGITIFVGVSSGWRQLHAALPQDARLAELRCISIGGETVTAADVSDARPLVSPDCIVYAHLGMTEAGTVAHYYVAVNDPLEQGQIALGYAVDEKTIDLLDNTGHPVAAGQIGEIAIHSDSLAAGYWKDPRRTSERFLSDPDDPRRRIYLSGDLGRFDAKGRLYHMGRKDFQVKIRGHRVEIPEVESELMALGAISEAAVIAALDESGSTSLVAYVTRNSDGELTRPVIRRQLAKRLPEHMIPSVVVFIDEMPRTATGKIDRLALPEAINDCDDPATPYVSPRTPLEEYLASLWIELLPITKAGVHDQFLDLGGNSLRLVQIYARIGETYRVAIPIQELFEAATVAGMASLLLTHLLDGEDRVVASKDAA